MAPPFFENQLSDLETTAIDQGPFYPDPSADVELWVRRLDLLDPVWGGNKFFKLKGHIEKAHAQGLNRFVSFGGAFSNHIAALARVGKMMGFETVGIIRGESEYAQNVTLARAQADGMKLFFVSRTQYRERYQGDFLRHFPLDQKKWYVVPEGGSGPEGASGCTEIMRMGDDKFNIVAVCCGTGATAAGLVSTLQTGQSLLGFSVLNDKGQVEKNVKLWMKDVSQKIDGIRIISDYNFGGFAKTTRELSTFIRVFHAKTRIEPEPVYTGKMFFGIYDMIQKKQFRAGTKILAIHTGGLQYLANRNTGN
jgi:1-aminocyclopropane-1-carboxylate deaminase